MRRTAYFVRVTENGKRKTENGRKGPEAWIPPDSGRPILPFSVFRSPFSLLCAALLLHLAACSSGSGLPGQGQDAGRTVVYRDTWGTAHIYAPTPEAGAYAMGYAQAEDRPEELLKNFLRGMGESAKVEGPQAIRSDLTALMWNHYGVSRRNASHIRPRTRGLLQAYVGGINDFYGEHPQDLPQWWGERKVDEFMVTAFARHFLYSWSIGDGYGDLTRAGIAPNAPEMQRASNQWAVSPSRSAEGAAILLIDPHLPWWGASRFWEFRIHAGDLEGSGVTLPGFPSIGLGHNANLAWAMTTGGPDTADVYELTLKPDDPTYYLYDGKYLPMSSTEVTLQVKGQPDMKATIWAGAQGPIVARRNGKAYALKTAYAEEVEVMDAWYGLNFAADYKEAAAALETLQLFPQNVMMADTSGNIYYQRTGRVPKRPEGYDWSRPVDGSTSATEWTGWHPASDLVQLLNPAAGFMQNCNIPPDAMLPQSPLQPAHFLDYIFSDRSHGPLGGWSNARGARAVELLAADDSVTAEEAIQYALDLHPYNVEKWLGLLTQADQRFGKAFEMEPDYASAINDLKSWDGRLQARSTAALKYYYWRRRLSRDPQSLNSQADQIDDYYGSVRGTSEPFQPTDAQLKSALQSLVDAMKQLKHDHGTLEAAYGDHFRVGRDERSWPVGGGGRYGTTTLRNVNYGQPHEDGTQWGQSGQTSTQVVVLSRPIRSWTALPIGESDRPESPHYTDQAEKLFSPRRLKPTWWTPEELRGHIESRRVLEKAP